MSQLLRTEPGVAEVASGVHRLGTKYINFYLIEEGGRLTLLDAGLSAYWPRLVQGLMLIGRRIDEIDAILLTHEHADHVGLAERVRRGSSARTYAHEADAPAIRGQLPGHTPNFVPRLWRPFVFKYVLHALTAGAARSLPVADLTTFGDGELVDVPGTPRVIHVPGHTAGSCALLLESRAVLFSGDALVTFNLLTGRPGPSLFPAFVHENPREAEESLSRLAAVGARVMLPGHGEPWLGGVAEAVRQARDAFVNRAT